MALVVITGGAKRIGRALALSFANNNWDVAIIYNQSDAMAHNTLNEIQSYNVNALALKADLRKPDEIKTTFELIYSQMGNINVLINNAGVFPKAKKLIDIENDLWEDTIKTNLSSQFYCSREFSKYASNEARIINIASLGGLEIWKNRVPYNVSKSGVIQLTKSLARELAPNISVNCICPGAILIPDEPSDTDSDMVNVDKIPMKRYGSVDDIFDAVYFFATASNYITGQVLCVDGGYHQVKS